VSRPTLIIKRTLLGAASFAVELVVGYAVLCVGCLLSELLIIWIEQRR